MARRTDVCAQCYGPKEDPKRTRCDGCRIQQRERHREVYEQRKADGQCVKCGVNLPDDAPTVKCQDCRGRSNESSARSQSKALQDPARRRAFNEDLRRRRRRRREDGRCLFCNKRSTGARCDEHKALEVAAYQERKERGNARAPTKRGRELAVLLDFMVDAAPTHLEDPIPMRELLARVVETYGSVSATEVGAERRMHRSLVALVEEGRLVRVTGRGEVAGYRRPPPRQVRQRVSTLSSTTTAGVQPGAATGNRRPLAASQDAAVVNQDSHPG